MNIEIVSGARVICSNRESFQSYFAWPTVGRLPGGELALVGSGFRIKHLCPFGKAIICYSRNEGKSWTLPAPVIDTPLDDRDGGIASNGNKVIVTSFNNTVAIQHKWNEEQKLCDDDHIRSASENNLYLNTPDSLYHLVKGYLDNVNAKEAEEKFLGSVYKISEDGGFTFGEIKKIPVTCPHGPGVLNDGRFIYVGTSFNPDKGNDNDLACYVMNNEGDFELTGKIENLEPIDGVEVMICEPHTLVLPDGKIIVHIRVQSSGENSTKSTFFTTYQSESCDGGKTFTKPHLLFADKRFGAPAHLMLTKSGVIVSTLGLRDEPYGIKVIISEDNGESWQDMGLIYNNNCASQDIGYPSSVELNDGTILTTFYAHQTKDAPSEIMQVVWKLK